MTINEIAHKFVELCRKGQFDDCYRELFSDDALSLEPGGMPNGRTEGKEALLAKSAQFKEMTEEIFALEVSDPVVADNYFCVSMMMDSKMKERPRMKMTELCMYEVQGGKIVKEQFFYTMPSTV